jgi:hypothetical protein
MPTICFGTAGDCETKANGLTTPVMITSGPRNLELVPAIPTDDGSFPGNLHGLLLPANGHLQDDRHATR